MFNFIRAIGVNSTIGVFSKLVVYLLLPYILKETTSDIFATYSTLIAFILWFEKISVSPNTNGLLRWYHDKTITEFNFNGISTLSLFISLILCFILSTLFLFVIDINYLVLFLMFITTINYSYIESYLRFKKEHLKAAYYMGIRTTSIPIMQYLLLITFGNNIYSFIIPLILSNILYGLLGSRYFINHIKIGIIFENYSNYILDYVKMIKYSIPLVMVGIVTSTYYLYDKIIIEKLIGSEYLSSYVLSWQVSAVILIGLATPFKQVITPNMVSLDATGKQYEKIFLKYFLYITIFSICSIYLIILFLPHINNFIIADTSFFISSKLTISLITLHYTNLLLTFYKIPFLIKKNVNLVSFYSTIPFLLLFILLPILISRYGFDSISYLILFISFTSYMLIRFLATKYIKINFQIIGIEILNLIFLITINLA